MSTTVRRPFPALPLTALAALAALAGCQTPSSGTPGPTPTPGQICRDFATRMVLSRTSVPSGLTATGTGNCTFDRSKATLECVNDLLFNNGCAVSSKIVRSYASVNGFVQEFSPAGRILALSETQDDTFQGGCFGGSASTTTFRYDSNSRLIGSQLARTTTREDRVFTAWDSNGRPTSGTVADVAFCPAMPLNVVYDDSARAWQSGAGVLGSACALAERTILDGNRNVVSYDVANGVPVVNTSTVYTVVATERVCN